MKIYNGTERALPQLSLEICTQFLLKNFSFQTILQELVMFFMTSTTIFQIDGIRLVLLGSLEKFNIPERENINSSNDSNIPKIMSMTILEMFESLEEFIFLC